jgi:hypothetical protein
VQICAAILLDSTWWLVVVDTQRLYSVLLSTTDLSWKILVPAASQPEDTSGEDTHCIRPFTISSAHFGAQIIRQSSISSAQAASHGGIHALSDDPAAIHQLPLPISV